MRILTIAALASLAVDASAQQQWSQFRGPAGRGVAADDSALPVEFGPQRNLIWKRALSAGHSSPCIWGDRIFLTGASEKELETLCIDRATGEILWRRSVTVERIERGHPINSAASPTPTSDGQRVFAYFGSFGLLCYDFAGEEQWRRPMPVVRNMYGTASSPIIARGRLILNRDTQEASFLEAIDPASGKTIWRRDRDGFSSGWSTPVLWHRDGVDELVVYGALSMVGYALEDGAERWQVPGLTDEPAITPVTGEGMVFLTSYNMNTNPEVVGLPQFAALLEKYDEDHNGRLDRKEAEANDSVLSRYDADGEGDHPLRIFFRFLDEDKSGEITADEYQKIFTWLGQYTFKNAILAVRPGGDGVEPEIVWQFPRGVPECPSPLYYEGRIYVVKSGGLFTCLDAKTGELEYEGRIGARGPRYSSPVAGDGKIYAASARGVVTVLEAGDALKVLANNDLGERIMATPALVDGKVYVRTEENLYAFGTRK